MAQPVSAASYCVPSETPEPQSVAPSGVPLCASAPPVRGYLRITPNTRNPFFAISSSFFEFSDFSHVLRGLHAMRFKTGRHHARMLPPIMGQKCCRCSYPQGCSGMSASDARVRPRIRRNRVSVSRRYCVCIALVADSGRQIGATRVGAPIKGPTDRVRQRECAGVGEYGAATEEEAPRRDRGAARSESPSPASRNAPPLGSRRGRSVCAA